MATPKISQDVCLIVYVDSYSICLKSGGSCCLFAYGDIFILKYQIDNTVIVSVVRLFIYIYIKITQQTFDWNLQEFKDMQFI